MTPALDLVGPGEIAERLGVKRVTVAKWKMLAYLPPPVAHVAAGSAGKDMPIWLWSDIEVWARRTGRIEDAR